MHHNYRHEFEINSGYRLFRDQVSVLLQSNSFGRRLTNAQNVALAKALDDFLDAVREHKAVQAPSIPDDGISLPDRPLSKADFAEAPPGPFYKYVREDTWNYIRQGSFQFATAEYYRNTPNIDIQDRREGAGHFHLISGNDQLNVSLISGYNCTIYCGTSQIDGSNDALMRERFGPRRIKIDPITEFIARARQLLGAHRSRMYDAVYRDIQSYTEEFPGVERFIKITRRGNLTEAALGQLNEEFFDTFYEFGLMPGLYAKPNKYSVERERRIIFETEKDIREGPKIVDDKALLDFVTFLDN